MSARRAELAATSDALAVRTTSAAYRSDTGNLTASEAAVTRLRLGLEGTWRGMTLAGGAFTPRIELGVRHDGGAAETEFGLDLGGGLAWTHAASGLAAEVSGRGLLKHESGFRDRGIAGSLSIDPRPETPGRCAGRASVSDAVNFPAACCLASPAARRHTKPLPRNCLNPPMVRTAAHLW